jgi:hypothetical protein
MECSIEIIFGLSKSNEYGIDCRSSHLVLLLKVPEKSNLAIGSLFRSLSQFTETTAATSAIVIILNLFILLSWFFNFNFNMEKNSS